MNSNKKYSDKTARSAYCGREYHLHILKETIAIFEHTTVGSDHRINPFINGVLISSKSITNLYNQIEQFHPSIDYLITGRLNQDVLEHTFGVLRQMGRGHEHPDTVSFKYRMRRFILSRYHVLVTVNPNTTLAKDESFLASGIKTFKENSSPIRKVCIAPTIAVNEDLLTLSNIEIENYADAEDELETENYEVPCYEEDGFNYVLGFVANKFEGKFQFLLSSEEITEDWIARKDHGGLKRMKSEFVGYFRQVERQFKKYHGLQELKPGCGAVENVFVRSQLCASKMCYTVMC